MFHPTPQDRKYLSYQSLIIILRVFISGMIFETVKSIKLLLKLALEKNLQRRIYDREDL